jgi:hypothetical protein
MARAKLTFQDSPSAERTPSGIRRNWKGEIPDTASAKPTTVMEATRADRPGMYRAPATNIGPRALDDS